MVRHVWLRLGREAPAETAAEMAQEFPGVRFSAEPKEIDYAGIDAVFTRNRLPDEVTAALTGLEWIHTTYGGGLSFLTDDVRRRGIVVTCSRGVQADPLSEFTEAALLAIAKKMPLMAELKRARKWDDGFELDTLAGKTALLLGLGAVNSAVARRLHRQGVRVLAIRRNVEDKPSYVDGVHGLDALARLLPETDYLVIGLPPVEGLNGLIGEAELRALRPGGAVVNLVSRGVVRDAALAKALREGWLSGAACNVFEANPPPPESELWDAPNLIVSPGVASTDPLRWRKLRKVFTDNLARRIEGAPMHNIVDGAGAY